jgi:hypothetical protein
MNPTFVTFGNTLERPGLASEQRSYSTADVEHAVFYGEVRTLDVPPVTTGAATLLVVNGEFFELSEEASPMPWSPLTTGSGLFGLAGSLEG